jgi:hypothetical protein
MTKTLDILSLERATSLGFKMSYQAKPINHHWIIRHSRVLQGVGQIGPKLGW